MGVRWTKSSAVRGTESLVVIGADTEQVSHVSVMAIGRG